MTDVSFVEKMVLSKKKSITNIVDSIKMRTSNMTFKLFPKSNIINLSLFTAWKEVKIVNLFSISNLSIDGPCPPSRSIRVPH